MENKRRAKDLGTSAGETAVRRSEGEAISTLSIEVQVGFESFVFWVLDFSKYQQLLKKKRVDSTV